MSNTKTIARNTGWYGLENLVSALLTMVTSIAIARFLGPAKMAYIIYVAWLSSVVTSLGSLGIPSTTQKYMAEFIGMGDRGTARHIYFRTIWLQVALGGLATAGLIVWVWGDAPPDYRLAAVLVVLSILPAMINSVPAQANVAAEDLSRNLPASVISIFIFFAAILATVIFGWGIVGVGASMLLTRLVDCLIRLIPTTRWIYSWDRAHVHPEGLRERMLTFAWQSVTTMLLAMVVWDKCEFVLLKHFCSDIKQIAYYSVAFNISEKLLLTAAVFGSATGATIFAQYGRDKSRVASITASSFRYLALSSIPVHFIAATLAFPMLLVLYGQQYAGAAVVVAISPILCLPKAFMGPVQNLLQSNENQKYIIGATVLAGIIDISVAWWLIRANYGAVGACIGSGAAQFTAVGIMWAVGIKIYKVRLPWLQLSKICTASLAAAVTAHLVATAIIRYQITIIATQIGTLQRMLAPLWAVIAGGTAALVVLLALFYLLRVLEPEDRTRFNILTGMLPKRMANPADKLIAFLIRPEIASATASNV
jgi:O-antigen/teichoic acid export membrane protein